MPGATDSVFPPARQRHAGGDRRPQRGLEPGPVSRRRRRVGMIVRLETEQDPAHRFVVQRSCRRITTCNGGTKRFATGAWGGSAYDSGAGPTGARPGGLAGLGRSFDDSSRCDDLEVPTGSPRPRRSPSCRRITSLPSSPLPRLLPWSASTPNRQLPHFATRSDPSSASDAARDVRVGALIARGRDVRPGGRRRRSTGTSTTDGLRTESAC